ncbi:Ig-like domain (group 3) [Micrococcales bacterium KH10]|nr:Ig-like domain (group 3) [Micrococcales bacterium KH10]
MSQNRRLRRIISTTALVCTGALVLPTSAHAIAPDQIMAAGVYGFSDAPTPGFGTSNDPAIDWVERARAFDAFAYDATDRGSYTTILPDETAHNMPDGEITFKMPAYYGDTRVQRLGENDGDGYQESVTQFSSIISATLVGIDKSSQECTLGDLTTCNYVDMLQTYFHQDIGVAGNTPLLGKAGDGQGLPGSQDGWYQFLPNVLYYMVGDMYPDATNMDTMLRRIADNYYDMVVDIGGPSADFQMQDYDFEAKAKYLTSRDQAVELAAATAAVLLWAHERFGDEKYLTGAKWTMDAAERSDKNTYYEMIPLLLPYLAARMNALHGTDYDIHKYIRWLMHDSKTRNGWGTVGGKNRYNDGISTWGGKQVAGLSGSLTDKGFDGDDNTTGYAFAMNSFATTWLAATAKYDTQYADTIGKWLLNVNNASRWFFADQMTANEQTHGTDFIDGVSTGQPGSSTGWDKDDRAAAIAYEGLQPHSTRGILATSDVPERSGNWGTGPDARGLGLYGSGWIGFMSVIKPTNVENVLKTDLNALDSYGKNDYPTWLIYNPTGAVADVDYEVSAKTDLYDAITGTYLVRDAEGTVTVPVPASGSVVVVELPVGVELVRHGSIVYADASPVAYITDPHRDLARNAEVAATPNDEAVVAVTDGDEATAWSAEAANGQSVIVDLGRSHELGSVTMAWGKTFPDEYTVATSLDGQSWSDAATVQSKGGIETVHFAARDAQRIRVTIAEGAGGFELRSMEARIADLARSKPVTVGGVTTSGGVNNVFNTPSSLTDGSDQTRWESRTAHDQWAEIDLGSAQPLGTVKIDWEGAYGKAYRIQVSNDGETWEDVFTRTNGSGGYEVLSLDEGEQDAYRYLRWWGDERGTSWAYSMWSLEVNAREGVTREGDVFIDERSVAPGDALALSGRGFQPGETVNISVAGESIAATADDDGAFEVSITVPYEPGDYAITIEGVQSGVIRTINLTVAAEPGAVTTSVTLNIAPGSLVADSSNTAKATVTVGADSVLPPQGTVRLVSNGVTLAQQPVADGSAVFDIVSSLAVGNHSIVAQYHSADADTWLDGQSSTVSLQVVPAPVTFSLAVARTTVGSATTATVTVSTPGKWTGGAVRITGWRGDHVVNVPASGRTQVKLPRLVKARNRTISATFGGSSRLAGSSVSAVVKVGKAKPKVKVKVAKRAQRGDRMRVRINVKRPKGVTAKGKAVIRVGGKKVKTVKVKKNGKATTRIKVNRLGKAKIRVNYKATKNLKKAKKTVTVQVRR